MPEVIIVDTSVLIALDKINLLPLLCNVYSEIWLPEGVKKEFGELLLPCAVIKKTENNLIQLLVADLNLGRGEAEVIVLASKSSIRVMMDDMKARKVATDLGIIVTGTLGFLLKANQLGLIESAYEKACELRDKGFFLSNKILADIQREELKRK